MGERVLSDISRPVGSDAPERTAPVLRERIYGAITCLSTLLILSRDSSSDITPSAAAIDLAVGGGALWGASLFVGADHVLEVRNNMIEPVANVLGFSANSGLDQ